MKYAFLVYENTLRAQNAGIRVLIWWRKKYALRNMYLELGSLFPPCHHSSTR